MNLPRFTFIIGSGAEELARAIETEVRAENGGGGHHVLISNMQDPLHIATLDLFYNRDILATEFSDPNVKVPILDWRVGDWFTEFRAFLRIHLGASALGRIALDTYQRDGNEEIFAHIIYIGVDSTSDIEPFATKFGGEHCLLIHAGSLATYKSHPQGAKVVWLAHADVKSRIAQLQAELTS
jgi:hypothetical protein